LQSAALQTFGFFLFSAKSLAVGFIRFSLVFDAKTGGRETKTRTEK